MAREWWFDPCVALQDCVLLAAGLASAAGREFYGVGRGVTTDVSPGRRRIERGVEDGGEARAGFEQPPLDDRQVAVEVAVVDARARRVDRSVADDAAGLLGPATRAAGLPPGIERVARAR